MDKETHDRGMAMRRKVLGEEYVDWALKSADDSTATSSASSRNTAGARPGATTRCRRANARSSTSA
jgi:hypothetical protein